MFVSMEKMDMQIGFVGGASRVGKDSISNELQETYPLHDIEVLSLDESVRLPYWNDSLLTAQAWEDKRSGSEETDLMLIYRKQFEEVLYPFDDSWIRNVLERREPNGDRYYIQKAEVALSNVLWKDGGIYENVPDHVHKRLIASVSGRLLIQGDLAQPEHIMSLPERLATRGLSISLSQIRPIYVGNESPKHADIMVDKVHEAIEAGHPEWNWLALRGWSDERIRAFMYMTNLVSAHHRQEAKKYGIPYIDMGTGEFTENTHRVVEYLATGVLA